MGETSEGFVRLDGGTFILSRKAGINRQTRTLGALEKEGEIYRQRVQFELHLKDPVGQSDIRPNGGKKIVFGPRGGSRGISPCGSA